MRTERGMVSLMITIIISLLLVIITTSMAILMVGELRQSTDSDQSTKAFYAAEAGIEEAVWRIRDALENGTPIPVRNDCSSLPPAANIDPNIAFTCQIIKSENTVLTDTVAKDEPRQYDVGSINFNNLELSWHSGGGNLQAPASFPPGSAWSYPAAMELTIISYPQTISDIFSDIEVKTFTLVPGGSLGSASANYNAAVTNPIYAQCTAGGTYNCRFTISGGIDSSRSHIVRFRPRYTGTSYQLRFMVGGTAVEMPDQFATIDVTARSGDVFRRVRSKVRIVNGVARGLDYVLFAETDICKNLTVRPSVDQIYEGNLCP
jgi:Tfp pilus assembly protein PilX